MSEEPHQPKFDYGPILLGLFGILCGATIVLAFHCVARGWCVRRQTRQSNRALLARSNQEISTLSIGSSNSSRLLSVYIYSKEWKEGTCAVCLSEFTAGVEVRILPGCEHAFHVPCIDMWLYTHPSCPLCRTGTMPMATHQVVSMPNSGELPPPIEPLPSSSELLPLENHFPGSAGLPSPLHSRVPDLND